MECFLKSRRFSQLEPSSMIKTLSAIFSQITVATVTNDTPEEYSYEDHKGREDPYDEDPLVENVVEGEPHVRRQLLQAANVLLHLEEIFLVGIFGEKHFQD